MEVNKYVAIWKAYLPALYVLMKRAVSNPDGSVFKTEQHKFEQSGKKEKAGYNFKLEYFKGRNLNEVGNSALASDLLQALNSDARINQFSYDCVILFQHTSSFELKITILPPRNL
jgi:hypothetical protein